MKKYRICLFLFLGVSLVCVLIAFFVRRNWENSGAVDTPETAIERDTVPETVTEDGILLVFLKDRKTICLYTHVPLMDFPPDERAKLREGLWFSSMAEVFNYLESYTS